MTRDALAPHGTGGVYLNIAGFGDAPDVHRAHGGSAAQLKAVRRAYDPEGVFDAAAGRP